MSVTERTERVWCLVPNWSSRVWNAVGVPWICSTSDSPSGQNVGPVFKHELELEPSAINCAKAGNVLTNVPRDIRTRVNVYQCYLHTLKRTEASVMPCKTSFLISKDWTNVDLIRFHILTLVPNSRMIKSALNLPTIKNTTVVYGKSSNDRETSRRHSKRKPQCSSSR